MHDNHGGSHHGHGGMAMMGLWGFIASFPNFSKMLILFVLAFLLK